MLNPAELSIKIFADGADLVGMREMYANPLIKGFTTNPTLMYKAGIRDYREFAHQIITAFPDRPISLEVFSDDFAEMELQALEIASWGGDVYVKIPVMNTQRQVAYPLISRLAAAGVRLNVTAIMTLTQVEAVADAMASGPGGYVSVFAGRVADTGRDPVPMMAQAAKFLQAYPQLELLWASPRELLNVFQAEAVGCHIITATNDILKKLALVGKDLDDFSQETVQMFYDDGQKAGFNLEISPLITDRVQAAALR